MKDKPAFRGRTLKGEKFGMIKSKSERYRVLLKAIFGSDAPIVDGQDAEIIRALDNELQAIEQQVDGHITLASQKRQVRALRLRTGLDDGESKTLEAVGKMFDLSRERIRGMEARILRLLRHPRHSRQLRKFLTGDQAF